MNGSYIGCIAFYRMVQRRVAVRLTSVWISSRSQEGLDDPARQLALSTAVTIAHPGRRMQGCKAARVGNVRIRAGGEQGINRLGIEEHGSVNQRMPLGKEIIGGRFGVRAHSHLRTRRATPHLRHRCDGHRRGWRSAESGHPTVIVQPRVPTDRDRSWRSPNHDEARYPWLMSRMVAITGLGVATGLGIGAEALWEGLLAGRSAIGPIRQFDATAFPVNFAAEVDPSVSVRDFVPKTYRKAVKVMCRDVELAVIGAAKAVEDARMVTKAAGDGEVTFAPNRVGCQIGSGLIVAEINELTTAFAKACDEHGTFSMKRWGNEGMNELTPLWLLKYLPNMLACHVTIVHDCRGPSNTITCGEASGALSIGESRRVIERGDADVCFSGGAESKINMLGLLRQFHTEMIAATTPDMAPGEVVRPFGIDARGSLPGEGAAILMVESIETAQQRGARVYAEILGFGATQSADLSTCPPKPDASGDGLADAIEQALTDARIKADAIDAIVPLGAGDPDYDAAEAAALRRVFGLHLPKVPLVTTKPNIGLCAAATSALDVAAGALCVHHQALPARIAPGAAMDGMDAGATRQRDARLEYVLVCGSGFGGQNTAVVLKRHKQSA